MTELTLRLRQSDERAFHELFVLYGSRLTCFVQYFLKDKAPSEDVVQEAFLAVWQHREGLDERQSLEAYLFRTAKNLTLNALRKQTHGLNARRRFFQRLQQHCNDTEHTILHNDLRRHTEQVLLTLPPQQQQVFRLSRFEGLTFDQISERMHISPHTVKNHLLAALKMMRKNFLHH
ncbi:RNA polymerase sigma-70 factor [Dinghuibacter silviterrae]|uniref:RNA polymerase sigma-70 factor (ECF subfamily) n=1 Tax=Dinghuibacter silviterrae TaxID=1539049 RepID=A0A4R8DHX7_9BACT|nr:RNA polymerase sigma-70 factor [Dinghuibacter silviterrae]TDW96746.1 RNA polymerase sigma-70 factor (ECF subfamily) [Dinghuibacter silviterrae]